MFFDWFGWFVGRVVLFWFWCCILCFLSNLFIAAGGRQERRTIQPLQTRNQKPTGTNPAKILHPGTKNTIGIKKTISRSSESEGPRSKGSVKGQPPPHQCTKTATKMSAAMAEFGAQPELTQCRSQPEGESATLNSLMIHTVARHSQIQKKNNAKRLPITGRHRWHGHAKWFKLRDA